jgi:dihydropteroate synthase
VMGILNVTPDSFHAGTHQKTLDGLVSHTAAMINEGATIIDIGGQSTRPGSLRLSADAELERVTPVIELLVQKFPATFFSIDTYHSRVAELSVKAGIHMVNDISAGNLDRAMIPLVASLKVPYICMHMQGEPASMHLKPQYDDVVKEVLDFFIEKAAVCRLAGIHDVIIDPGFGFGKTIRHNFTLMNNLDVFKMLDCPILAGISRKSTIYKTLNTTPEESLNGTTVLNTIALTKGANILRVHDVREAIEAIKLTQELSKN